MAVTVAATEDSSVLWELAETPVYGRPGTAVGERKKLRGPNRRPCPQLLVIAERMSGGREGAGRQDTVGRAPGVQLGGRLEDMWGRREDTTRRASGGPSQESRSPEHSRRPTGRPSGRSQRPVDSHRPVQ